jgi:hypothetical protein
MRRTRESLVFIHKDSVGLVGTFAWGEKFCLALGAIIYSIRGRCEAGNGGSSNRSMVSGGSGKE